MYAIWAGVGTAPIAASGMLFLSESANAAKLLDIALVIAGMGRFNTCA
ncbi:SMR family transporter [Streptomyces sp. NPDC002845]